MANIMLRTSKFTNDAAGLEKTLRLLQSLSLIIAANVVQPAGWNQAKKQFALGRRYLRFTKFIDCFNTAYSAFSAPGSEKSGVVVLLEVGKWSCLGIYLLLESFTIMDAMGIWSTTWAPKLFNEAMKFWFYSLTCSLVLSLNSMKTLYMQPLEIEAKKGSGDEKTEKKTGKKVDEKPEKSEKAAKVELAKKQWYGERQVLMKKVIIDSCDLFIPATAVGWVVMRQDLLGMIMVTGTLLGCIDIWNRVNPL
ncbi:hypothetical protein BP6252_02797 [Coleophoma cylindrospora]|uniref:Uncharacterized protein n=1 Tax=Coleophoma cylindrospora TaxID=1849047 RepID=A0A3D8SFT7_9HELO|nr:hypothetical protein BP6252_02797 [Coleophoma cylindrospora]